MTRVVSQPNSELKHVRASKETATRIATASSLHGTGAHYCRVSDANSRAGGILITRLHTTVRLCVGERPVLKLSIIVQALGE